MDGVKSFSFPIRFFQYYPAGNPRGIVEEITSFPVKETAFIAMHTWNIGFPDGPPFPYDRLQIAGGTPEGNAMVIRIVNEQIAPALAAARTAGVLCCQVEPYSIAKKHPQHKYLLENPNGVDEPAPSIVGKLPEAIPGYRRRRQEATHGPRYEEWYGWEEMDVPAVIYPKPEEPMIVTAAQFDRILRERGVVNLVYSGFATNVCILDSQAGMKDMTAYGYRCILLREGTIGVEYPDTLKTLDMTRTAIKRIEHALGYTASVADFIKACEAVATLTPAAV